MPANNLPSQAEILKHYGQCEVRECKNGSFTLRYELSTPWQFAMCDRFKEIIEQFAEGFDLTSGGKIKAEIRIIPNKRGGGMALEATFSAKPFPSPLGAAVRPLKKWQMQSVSTALAKAGFLSDGLTVDGAKAGLDSKIKALKENSMNLPF